MAAQRAAGAGEGAGCAAGSPALPQLDVRTFDDAVYDAEGGVAVLFTRPGCAVCARVKPVFERVAAARASDGTDAGANPVAAWEFYEVDGQENLDLMQRLGLSGVPQIVLFREGEYLRTLAGAVGAAELEAALG